LIQQLQAQALAAWDKIHPDNVKPGALDYLIQSRDYIVVFWFDRGGKSKEPVLISKIPRTSNFNRYAERSVNLVDRLIADLKPPIRNTLPNRVIAGHVNNLTHIVMGIVPGEPIILPPDSPPGRRTVERHLSAFLDWLVEFQAQATLNKKVYAWEDLFQGYQEEPGLGFSRSDPYQGISQELIHRLPITEMPLTWGYGDAHHSNILLEKGQVSGVIDWIGVKEETWFFTDWYYFLFFYALEFYKKNARVDSDAQRRLAISTTFGIYDHWLAELFKNKTKQFLEHYSFDLKSSPEFTLTFLYDLHWPQGKGKLLKEAYSIYDQVPR
jgi:hypothetical protein